MFVHRWQKDVAGVVFNIVEKADVAERDEISAKACKLTRQRRANSFTVLYTICLHPDGNCKDNAALLYDSFPDTWIVAAWEKMTSHSACHLPDLKKFNFCQPAIAVLWKQG